MLPSFADLYVDSSGRCWLASASGVLTVSAADEIARLGRTVMAAGDGQPEFDVREDGITYRCTRIDGRGGAAYAVRRPMQPLPGLAELGLPAPIAHILSACGRRTGLLIITGPARAGKTTTAGSCLVDWLRQWGGVAVTVEDPPELPLEGQYGTNGLCWQMAVDAGGDFRAPLERAMRLGLRYLYVGEVRSPATADQAVLAGRSGHLVLCTLHAGSIDQALGRLIRLLTITVGDLAREDVADALVGVLYQQLAPGEAAGVPRPEASALFCGRGAADPVRAKIRTGRLEQLATDLDCQRRRLRVGQPPVADL